MNQNPRNPDLSICRKEAPSSFPSSQLRFSLSCALNPLYPAYTAVGREKGDGLPWARMIERGGNEVREEPGNCDTSRCCVLVQN